MYIAYGDKKILENQYASMKAWVKYMTDSSINNLWNHGFHFGDWLFYRPFDDNDGRAAVTDKYLIAQCFYANSVQIMVNTAKVLNNASDEAMYSALLQKLKDAFLKEYVTPNGRLISGTQTAYVLALNFDMLPENLRFLVHLNPLFYATDGLRYSLTGYHDASLMLGIFVLSLIIIIS